MAHVAMFDHAVTEQIARAVAETYSGSQLTPILREAGVQDAGEGTTKWRRVCDGLEATQRQLGTGQRHLNLVTQACKPARFIGQRDAHEALLHSLNQALAFAGYRVDAEGRILRGPTARSLEDIAHLAKALRTELERRDGHAEVFRYCNEALLQEDCFGAVFEAVKGLGERVRTLTGLTSDGNQLIQDAFEGTAPHIQFNPCSTRSQLSEQRGLASIAKGILAAFRNPLAHEPRIHWEIDQADALDLLTTLSLLHRRLDAAEVSRRPLVAGGRQEGGHSERGQRD